MLGTSLLQHILEFLVRKHLPTLHTHLDSLKFPLSLITQAWFITLFFGVLPIHVALRVFDVFVFEGTEVLLRVALAVLQLKQEKLLQAKGQVDIITCLQGKIMFTAEELMPIAQSFELPEEKLESIQSVANFNLLGEMEKNRRAETIKALRKKLSCLFFSFQH